MTTNDQYKHKQLKVMYIITRLNIGGLAAYLVHITAEQRRLGNDCLLVCGVVGPQEGDMSYVARERGIDPIVIPTLEREISPLNDLKTIWALYRLIRHERPDVVHTHTSKAGLTGRLAAWLAGVPVIMHHFHGHVFEGYFSPRRVQIITALERLCARACRQIITVSEALRVELAERFHIAPREKIAIIETGFDLTALATITSDDGQFRAAKGIPSGVPLVGAIARLVPIKNLELCLQAARLVIKQIPDAHVAIVGDGESRAALEAYAHELGIADQVHFCGWAQDTVQVYRALDCFVLSSLNEGLPGVLIEAMAARVPVVATPVGGVPDLLQQGALGALVPLDDPASMSAAIIAAVRGGRAAERVLHAQQVITATYSIERSVARCNALYRQFLPADR